jgi:hypothetical protein
MPIPTVQPSTPSSRLTKSLVSVLVVLIATALYLSATESQPVSLAMKKFLGHLGGHPQSQQSQQQQQQEVASNYAGPIQAPTGGGKRNVGYFVSVNFSCRIDASLISCVSFQTNWLSTSSLQFICMKLTVSYHPGVSTVANTSLK